MAQPGVEIKNVVKQFQGSKGQKVFAVNNVSFAVAKGELVTLLGPSGCGKTTLLRMIGGFETQTSGDILIDGESMGLLPPNRRNTSMMFQSYALFPHMSVYDNIAYGLRIRKTEAAELKSRVTEMMDVMGLKGFENRYPAQLSGGQQQRVALARALVTRPSVLLLDEPLSNLDAKLRVSAREEVRRIQRELNITSIYVTHDQEEAMHISDRIVALNAGRIEQIGSPEEIYQRPASLFTADFFGKVNFLDATVGSVEGGAARVTALGREWSVAARGAKPGPAKLALRPEAIGLDDAGETVLDGVVISSVFAGNKIEYAVTVGGVSLNVEAPAGLERKRYADGDAVKVGLSEKALHLIQEN